jgi:hypothetical protein
MTTTQATNSAKANRLAALANNAQAQSDAYTYLIHLLETDPKLAAIKSNEHQRMVAGFEEMETGAEDFRGEALAAGYDPDAD